LPVPRKRAVLSGDQISLAYSWSHRTFPQAASTVRWKLYKALAVVLTSVPSGDCALSDSSLPGMVLPAREHRPRRQSSGKGFAGDLAYVPGSAHAWCRPRSAVMIYSTLMRFFKLIFYQKEVKSTENCPFLMIIIKKFSLNGVYVLKISSKNLRKKQSPANHLPQDFNHQPLDFSIPRQVLILRTAPSK